MFCFFFHVPFCPFCPASNGDDDDDDDDATTRDAASGRLYALKRLKRNVACVHCIHETRCTLNVIKLHDDCGDDPVTRRKANYLYIIYNNNNDFDSGWARRRRAEGRPVCVGVCSIRGVSS